jgi:hypothetical protein
MALFGGEFRRKQYGRSSTSLRRANLHQRGLDPG